MGLLMNGFLKIPMQFLILFIGVLVFVFYQFITPPIHFNQVQTELTSNEFWSTTLPLTIHEKCQTAIEAITGAGTVTILTA